MSKTVCTKAYDANQPIECCGGEARTHVTRIHVAASPAWPRARPPARVLPVFVYPILRWMSSKKLLTESFSLSMPARPPLPPPPPPIALLLP